MKTNWLVIAHRGASKHAPENTIESFELAVKQKADYIELDIWETADRELVVVHDEKLPDASGKKVTDVSRDELVEIYRTHRNLTVPTFEEVLQSLQNKIKFDIEVKFHGREADIISLTSSYLDSEDFIITSFFPKVLKTASKVDKDVNIGYLMSPLRLNDWIDTFRTKEAVMMKCTTILPYWRMATRRLIEKYQEKGIQTWTWVINDKKRMLSFIKKGGTGIITDDPALAITIREGT